MKSYVVKLLDEYGDYWYWNGMINHKEVLLTDELQDSQVMNKHESLSISKLIKANTIELPSSIIGYIVVEVSKNNKIEEVD